MKKRLVSGVVAVTMAAMMACPVFAAWQPSKTVQEVMGHYFRVAADNRDLNYDKFVVKGEVHTMADESYTSHNTNRLDVEGTVKKILTTEYVQNELKGIPNV